MTDLDRLATALHDRYRLEREVGSGGMATVYLGEDLRHQRRVAVKVLRPDLSAIVGADRFLNEIRVTANLQHPHILPLYDSGSADGLLFYVMPFVQGESLRDRLSREKQLPIDEAVRLAKEVASALDYAHRQGVIHRDIKPENILLQDGTALVTDFGIALAVSQAGGKRMTETGLSLGTPYYMSPEQATGDRQIDARSDIYALGAVLYEMLSGDPPHTGSTAQAIIAAVVTEEPRDIATRRPRLAPHIAEAVHRALEKLPADRFASAAEFAKALDGGGGAVTTGRFAAAPSARRAARRSWVIPAVLVAGIGIGLLAGRALLRPVTLRETRTRLTFSGNASAPSTTRDGRWLAYLRGPCRTTGADCDGDVVVQELPRGAPSVLLSGVRDASMGGFSPDGNTLLVLMRSAAGELGLYVIPRQGGVARKIAGGAVNYGFVDDRTVGFCGQGGSVIRLVDIASGEVRDSVVVGDGRWALNSLDFNPATGFIYFAGIHGSSLLQGVADRRGRVLDSLKLPGGGGWDTDGHHLLVYELGSQSVGSLLRIPVSGSGRLGAGVTLMTGLRQDGVTGFATTPTGLVFGDAGRTADVWSFSVRGALRRLTHGSTWYYGPAISPDGRTVAYVKQDAWGANVYTVPSTGGPETAVTSDSGTRQLLRWLPDKRRLSDLVLAAAGSGRITQEVVDPATGRIRTLALDQGIVIVAWRPDGTAVAEEITGSGLALLDSAGRTVHRASVPDSLGAVVGGRALSPDGRSMVLVTARPGGMVAWAVELGTGAVRRIGMVSASDSVRARPLQWATDGFVYFVRVAGVGQPELWRMPASGGALARYAPLPLACDVPSLTLVPDAQSGACIVYDDRPDLWLVERR
jgi:eukaryotic-like serine/threonine-protein kinase